MKPLERLSWPRRALLTEFNSRIRDVQMGPGRRGYVLTDSSTDNPNTPWTSKLFKLTPK